MTRMACALALALLVATALGNDTVDQPEAGEAAPARSLADDGEDTLWNNKVILACLELTGLGVLGLDRFYMGSYITGVVKLVTGGGFGIWALVDYVLVLLNCIMGSSSIDILWMSMTFGPSLISAARWVSIIGLVITFCCPGVVVGICGTGFLASIPIVGRFFRRGERVEDQNALMTREGDPERGSRWACCGR